MLGDCQFHRRKRVRFCHGCKSNQAHTENIARIEIPRIQSQGKDGDSGIPLSASRLEETLPFCGNEIPPATGTGNKPENAAYDRPLRIPCSCDESGFRAGTCLVFLQRQSGCGTLYQRTETRLLYEQNTNKNIYGEPVASATAASGLQFIPLVPGFMFTGTFSDKITQMVSPEYSCRTRQIPYTRSQEYAGIPHRFYKQETLERIIRQC